MSNKNQIRVHRGAHQEMKSSLSAEARLRLVSYNIQVGIETNRYRDYVSGSWRHFLPCSRRQRNLEHIANLIRDYDIVALQEVDAGSLRGDYINQVEYLAMRGNFPHWYLQINRNLGRFAQHALGLLSRIPPQEITEHKLPGVVPGRGAMVARFGSGARPLVVVILHLALGRRTRNLQLEFVRELTKDDRHVILMGDFNCEAAELMRESPLVDSPFIIADESLHTFPSWAPQKKLDHILLTHHFPIQQAFVLENATSDHLPLAVEVELPHELKKSLVKG